MMGTLLAGIPLEGCSSEEPVAAEQHGGNVNQLQTKGEEPSAAVSQEFLNAELPEYFDDYRNIMYMGIPNRCVRISTPGATFRYMNDLRHRYIVTPKGGVFTIEFLSYSDGEPAADDLTFRYFDVGYWKRASSDFGITSAPGLQVWENPETTEKPEGTIFGDWRRNGDAFIVDIPSNDTGKGRTWYLYFISNILVGADYDPEEKYYPAFSARFYQLAEGEEPPSNEYSQDENTSVPEITAD